MRPRSCYRDDLGMTTTEHEDSTEITTPRTCRAIAVAAAPDLIAGLLGRPNDH
jgi:hypothetical protein